VKDGKLVGDPSFDSEDEFAQKIRKKVEKRIIQTGSVGFFPSKIELMDEAEDGCRVIYRKQELREFSLCNVPANPNATIIEPGKAEIIEVDYEDRFERIEGDIEDLKEMQITLSEKIDKKAIVNPLEGLFAKSKPQPQGLEKLFKKSDS